MPSSKSAGKLQICCKSTEKVKVEWRISNISSLLDKKRVIYTSPEFSYSNNRWNLRLLPNWKRKPNRPNSGFSRLGIWKCTDGLPETFLLTSGMIWKEGVKYLHKRQLMPSKNYNSSYICRRSELMNLSKMVPPNTLRIMCIIEGFCPVGTGLPTDIIVKNNNANEERKGNKDENDYKDGKALKIKVQQRNEVKKAEKRSSHSILSSDYVEGGHKDHKNDDDDDYKDDDSPNSKKVKQQKLLEKAEKSSTKNVEVKTGEDEEDGQICNDSGENDRKDGDKVSKKKESLVRRREVVKNAEKRFVALVRDLGKLLSSGVNSDISVQVGDTEFKLHKNILSARSPVLSAMLKDKAANDTISICGCEPDVFRQYLQYLYTSSVQLLSAQNAFHLYRVARNYLSDELKEQCLMHIQETLSVQTFCDAVKLALAYGESGLLGQAIGFASENLRLIVCTREWQDFNREYPSEANEVLIKALEPPSVCPKLKCQET